MTAAVSRCQIRSRACVTFPVRKLVRMILSAYRFEGDPAVLRECHQRLLELFPPGSLDLHLAVTDDEGLTIFDACPDLATQAAFAASPEFRGAIERAGLPAPAIQVLGEVQFAHMREPIRR